MKKALSILLVMMMLTGAFIGMVSTVKAQNTADSTTLIDDDFESYPVGTFPSGYDMVYNGAGDEYQKITNTYSNSGTQSFTLKGADSWSVVVEKKIDATSDVVSISGVLMSETPTHSINSYGKINGNIAIGFWNASAATWGEYYGDISFSDDGIIKLGGGENSINLTSYKPYVWYNVELVLDISKNTIDAYINNTWMAHTTLENNATKMNAIFLGNGWSGVVGYVDDIKVWCSSESQSALIDDDFESYPVGAFPSGYDMVYNGAGDEYQKITNAYSYSGSQSFTLKGQDSWSVSVEKKINVTSDVVSISGMLMSETPKHSINSYGKINGNIGIGFWNASASTWGETYGYIVFGDDGIIKLAGGESVINLTTYKPYTWYNVKLVLSISQNTVDAYINNTWMVHTALKNDASKMNAVVLGNGWSGVVGYIDDIKVSEGEPISTTIPPSAPQNLQVSAGDGYVNLSWSPPIDDGGSAITNYRIYRGTTSGGETFLADVGNVLTYTDNSVTNGQTYYYQVSAVNPTGEGNRSDVVQVTLNYPQENHWYSDSSFSIIKSRHIYYIPINKNIYKIGLVHYVIGPENGVPMNLFRNKIFYYFGLNISSDDNYSYVSVVSIYGFKPLLQSINHEYNKTLRIVYGPYNIMSSVGYIFNSSGALTLFSWAGLKTNTNPDEFLNIIYDYLGDIASFIKSDKGGALLDALIDTLGELNAHYDLGFGIVVEDSMNTFHVLYKISITDINNILLNINKMYGSIKDYLEVGEDLFKALITSETGVGALYFGGIAFLRLVHIILDWTYDNNPITHAIGVILSIADPNQTTIYPSIKNNSETVLGYDKNTGNFIQNAEGVGFVMTTDNYTEIFLTNNSLNYTYKITCVGDKNTEVPYVTYMYGSKICSDTATGILNGGSEVSTNISSSKDGILQWKNQIKFSQINYSLKSNIASITGEISSPSVVYIYLDGVIKGSIRTNNTEFNYKIIVPSDGKQHNIFLQTYSKENLGDSYTIVLKSKAPASTSNHVAYSLTPILLALIVLAIVVSLGFAISKRKRSMQNTSIPIVEGTDLSSIPPTTQEEPSADDYLPPSPSPQDDGNNGTEAVASTSNKIKFILPDREKFAILSEGSERTTIGRNAIYGYIPEDMKDEIFNISRKHCDVWNENGQWYIEDKGSTNGTSVNGEEIKGKGPVPLKGGDEVVLGNVLKMKIRI